MLRLHHFITVLLLTLPVILWPAASIADDIDFQKKIEDLQHQLADDPDNVTLLTRLSAQYLWQGNNERAMEIGRHLLEIGKRGGVDSQIATLHGHIIMGQGCTEFGNPVEGFRHLETARGMAERMEDHRALLSIYSGLGSYALNTHNDAYSALDYFFKALDECHTLNMPVSIALHLSNIAECYITRKDASGLPFARQGHEWATKTDNATVKMFSAMNLADFYLFTDSLDKAAPLIDEAWEYHTESGQQNSAELLVLTSRLQAKLGDLKVALGLAHQALSLLDGASTATANRAWLYYARILRMMGRHQDAIEALQNGLDHVKNNSSEIYIADFYKDIAECYGEAGNPEKALLYTKRYIEYQDSAQRIDRERTLQEQRIKHEVFENERRIDEQRIELLSWRNRTIIIVSILVVVVLTLALLYYSYRKKNRLYRAIVAQNSDFINRERRLREQMEAASRPAAAPAEPSSILDQSKADDLMERFSELMMERKVFTDPSININNVADMLGTNRTYLSKAINESTGKTFTQVISDYRIHEAIKLVSDLESNLPLKVIANNVGFNSLSTFYSAFQSVTGMPPARYRAHLMNM